MNSSKAKADIGIIGGSGFYSFIENPEIVVVDTPYGQTSEKFTIGKISGKKIAFLPRHGAQHQYPPHMVPYRANIFGFKKLGVKYIISSYASGSLTKRIKPGDFVLCDQFVDRTYGRKDTFFDGPKTVHVSCEELYCPKLRTTATAIGEKLNLKVHKKGTAVVINGPRFSTRSESHWYRRQGWEVINMTQYPEVVLAREQEMCFLAICLITDYDTGLKGDKSVKPVTFKQLVEVFEKNNERVKRMIMKIIDEIDTSYTCTCHTALENAVF